MIITVSSLAFLFNKKVDELWLMSWLSFNLLFSHNKLTVIAVLNLVKFLYLIGNYVIYSPLKLLGYIQVSVFEGLFCGLKNK